ncbi:hypothetical protein Taro_006804 [Colocasia esculenta]|uniref:Uncharacterized protein n=1 Tax=Colocasia esculenta TaxID=4460 RepID=A0A843TYM5_COLES|nr:hypothetical protein [Colocasia esculenta]
MGMAEVFSSSSSLSSSSSHRQVKSRVGLEMKQDLLLFSWSSRPGVAVDWLASRLVDVHCLNLAAVDVDAKGSEEWLDDRRTRGVAELREETSRRGAIPVGARGGLGVNREIAGGFLQGLWPENLASTSFVAKLLSQDVNGQASARSREADSDQVRYRLTGLAEAFRHSWYQSKKFLKWLIGEIGVVEEMIRRKAPSKPRVDDEKKMKSPLVPAFSSKLFRPDLLLFVLQSSNNVLWVDRAELGVMEERSNFVGNRRGPLTRRHDFSKNSFKIPSPVPAFGYQRDPRAASGYLIVCSAKGPSFRAESAQLVPKTPSERIALPYIMHLAASHAFEHQELSSRLNYRAAGIGGFSSVLQLGPPDPLLVLQGPVRYRRPSSLLPYRRPPSVGPLGSGPSRKSPPRFWHRLWEGTTAMPHRRSSYQNIGSLMTRSRQSREDSRQRATPVDVTVAPAAATGGVPALAAVVPATALEMAELRGQMQQLTSICLGLQAQLAGQPVPAASVPQECQAESSHQRSRAPPAPAGSIQEQHTDSPQRSRRAPSDERALERSRLPRCSAAAPRLPRSVVGANSHKSGCADSAHFEQELARRLRHVVDLERRVDVMVQRA